jgi:hypothetical protein
MSNFVQKKKDLPNKTENRESKQRYAYKDCTHNNTE